MNTAAYIQKDDYAGPWVRSAGAMSVDTFTASELADFIGEGKTAPLWESFGHVRGAENFCRTRFVAVGGELHGFDADGVRTIIHPADRKIRVLTKR